MADPPEVNDLRCLSPSSKTDVHVCRKWTLSEVQLTPASLALRPDPSSHEQTVLWSDQSVGRLDLC